MHDFPSWGARASRVRVEVATPSSRRPEGAISKADHFCPHRYAERCRRASLVTSCAPRCNAL